MTKTRVRYQLPDIGEISMVLSESEKRRVDAATDAINVDLDGFIKLAFKWGNINHPEKQQEITETHKGLIQSTNPSDEQLAEIKENANSELLMTRVMDFVGFVESENPSPGGMGLDIEPLMVGGRQ